MAIPPSSWLYDRGNFRDALVRIWRMRDMSAHRTHTGLADVCHVGHNVQSPWKAVDELVNEATVSAHRSQPSATSSDGNRSVDKRDT